MKKGITFILALICMIMLVACTATDKANTAGNTFLPEKPEEHSFQATVLEVHDSYLLVEPAEGAWERTSADKIEVSLMDKTSWPIPQVGDTVNVFYNGEILETYPARVGKVFRVEIVR